MILDYLSAIEIQWSMNGPVLMNYRETEVRCRIRNRMGTVAETSYQNSRPYSVHNASIGLGVRLGN